MNVEFDVDQAILWHYHSGEDFVAYQCTLNEFDELAANCDVCYVSVATINVEDDQFEFTKEQLLRLADMNIDDPQASERLMVVEHSDELTGHHNRVIENRFYDNGYSFLVDPYDPHTNRQIEMLTDINNSNCESNAN